MPSPHVIVGAGPVGTTTALELARQGHQVRLVSRSGSGPEHAAIELVRADASDFEAMARVADDAAVLYNAVNPPYHRWPQDWPPMHRSLLGAAERSGAVYVMMDNLYAYGPVAGPLHEDLPLAATGTKGRVRATMAAEVLAAAQAGRVRAAIARASDFTGPRVQSSHLGERVVPKVLAGQKVRVLGDPDVPHTWTYVPDVARTLAVLGTDERAWGRVWHVPSAPPVSQREYIAALADAAGTRVEVATIPWSAVRALGLFVPVMRELLETRYQFDEPFVMDSSAAHETFDLQPTPIVEQAAATVAWWHSHSVHSRATAG